MIFDIEDVKLNRIVYNNFWNNLAALNNVDEASNQSDQLL